jgi:hypothetical protein
MERSEMRDGVGWQSFRAEAVSVCLPLCGEWTVRSYAPRRRIHHPTPPLISFASTLPLQGRVSELICPSGKSPPNAQNLSSPPRKKYFAFSETQISCNVRAVPSSQEGRLAIVTDVEAGCGGRKQCRYTGALVRTAKACGPGAPTLALS